MLTISDAAIAFIIKEENSDEGYYNKRCRGFEWPEGASGPTVGIGYDCGYCTREEIAVNWEGIIPEAMIAWLQRSSGIKGGNAGAWVRQHRHTVDITWAQACQQFTEREVPKWIERTAAAYPNCDLLSPDSLGALVSLSYNRGCDLGPGQRRLEMRQIAGYMAQKNFADIPARFRAMCRLWPEGSDLWRRRRHEADLFQQGLTSAGQDEGLAAPLA